VYSVVLQQETNDTPFDISLSNQQAKLFHIIRVGLGL
jgi:hypothetical protein